MGIAERREREKEQRQNDIIDAAERVFFSKGYSVATMDDISQEAELSKGTLYLYFNTKEELYLAVTLRGFKILYDLFETAAAGQEQGLQQLTEIGRAYVRFSKEHHGHFKNLMFFESKSLEFDKPSPWLEAFEEQSGYIFGKLTEVIETGIHDGSLRSDVDPVMMPLLLWAQFNGILQLIMAKGEMLEPHFNIGPDDLIEYVFQVVRGMIQPQPGER
jgi:AcrR family transcriptional regulator